MPAPRDFDHQEHDDDPGDDGPGWRRAAGSFVLVPVLGAARDALDAMRRQADPKLAATNPPHLSLTGSSGAGPILPEIAIDRVRECIEAAVRDTPPFTLAAGLPMRFPGTDIVSFELDPHGPLRALHERVKASGLRFGPVRFPFSPHLTISYYRTLDRAMERQLLALRLTEPIVVDRLELSRTNDPQPPETVLTVMLGGGA
ncbi:MAG: 2'-5' RNA ligase family protein [Gemmatimonadetes bacterium]|nr:2'-5' RNA ligase family protein [Gemmatimonadota bacterium]